MDSQIVPSTETTIVNVNTFASKMQSKGEIYRFLTVEAGFYLPPYANITSWHMRDLAAGDKKVGRCPCS